VIYLLYIYIQVSTYYLHTWLQHEFTKSNDSHKQRFASNKMADSQCRCCP